MINKMFKAIVCALNGFRFCCRMERNFRIHLLFAVLVTLIGLYVEISSIEWLVIGCCILVVLVLEMVNTAIEKLCDVVHPLNNPQIKIIKDVAAGAVLLAVMTSSLIGSFILF